MSPFRTSNPLSVLLAATAAAISLMVAAAAAGAGAGGAHAPDTPPPTAPAPSAGVAAPAPAGVHSSSRLYLRAGLSLDRSRETRFKDRDCGAPRPGHFYGCGPGVDGAPFSSLGDFGTIAGIELGIGYVASPVLRLDATAEIRPKFSFEGRSNYLRQHPKTVSADASSLSVMLSAYADLPGYGVPRLGPFSPFVGGGFGLSRIDIDDMRLDFPVTVVTIPGGHRTNFAWMLTAGLSTSLGERMTLDLAWRYTDFGAVETGRGTARTVCRDEGCGRASSYPVPETYARLATHGLHLSIRYPL